MLRPAPLAAVTSRRSLVRLWERARAESGAAVADFAMVSGLLVLVFLGLLQLGFALHVRNTLISCASEGARYGARLGSSPERGVERTRELITVTLPGDYARSVTALTEADHGVSVVRVHVAAPVPVLGPFGPPRSLQVDGRAFEETQ